MSLRRPHGINAVQGAAHAGAANILAVDPVAFKRETAEKLGATQSFACIEEAVDAARSLTNGQGADAAIVTVGATKAERATARAATHRLEPVARCLRCGREHLTEQPGAYRAGLPAFGRQLSPGSANRPFGMLRP